MLFHTFRNDEGKADVLIKVLAKSLGDDIYYRKDQFGRLIDFARGYCLQEVGGEIQYYVDIYTKKILYHCKRSTMGWDVEEEVNITGKLPLILFEQEPECAGVEPMINRKEWTISRTADVNDRFSDPHLWRMLLLLTHFQSREKQASCSSSKQMGMVQKDQGNQISYMG